MVATVGSVDRVRRLTVGLLLAEFCYAMPSNIWTAVAICAGAAPALTARVGFCPAYRLFGIRVYRSQPRGA